MLRPTLRLHVQANVEVMLSGSYMPVSKKALERYGPDRALRQSSPTPLPASSPPGGPLVEKEARSAEEGSARGSGTVATRSHRFQCDKNGKTGGLPRGAATALGHTTHAHGGEGCMCGGGRGGGRG